MGGVPLSEEGRVQAAALADALAGRPIAAVVSSPLQRARETAFPIAARLGLTVATDPGLDEIDFGSWTGREFAALDGRADWSAWNRFRSTGRCPGGESMLEAQARALACLTRLRSAHPDGEIVLVSHQDVLKAILAHALGLPLDLLHRITLDPARRSVLVLFEQDARVDGMNLP
jgi:probable phosphoglycerate mutase